MKFRTRAKTAYGLLSEVRRLILEEPKRYNQGDTLTIKGAAKDAMYEYPEYPNCGTVGCVAGWVAMLTAPRPSRLKDVLTYAGKKLGLSAQQQDALTDSAAAGPRTRLVEGGGYTWEPVYQTREHAERGAAHIQRFQQQYAAQLKRTRLS